MPDNSVGNNTEPAPRGKPLSGKKDFGMLRQTDGHITPEDDSTGVEDDRNMHEGW